MQWDLFPVNLQTFLRSDDEKAKMIKIYACFERWLQDSCNLSMISRRMIMQQNEKWSHVHQFSL